MSKKIYLSPSDQTNNAYAYGNTTEAAQCRIIADACEIALKRCGFLVKNNKTSSMAARVNESNSWGADLHICIHTNAYNGKVSGTRIFSYNSTGEGRKAANAVYKVLAPLTPGTSESVSNYADLYEIKNTSAPCVYCECEFHDVPSVAKWIVEHTTDIGEAIAKGICNYYGVTYKAPVVAKPTTTTSGTIYRVQVGAYSSKANAEAMQKKLKAAGFDGIITTK